MPVINTVQSGTAVFVSSSSVQTVTINSVVTDNSIIFWNMKSDGTNPRRTLYNCKFDSPTQISFQRDETSGSIDIQFSYSVAEFSQGVYVYHGSQTILSLTTNNISIAQVDTATSFAISTVTPNGGGTTFSGSNYFNFKLISPTSAQIVFGATGTMNVVYQIVEASNSSVQRGVTILGANTLELVVPIVAVDTSKSFVVLGSLANNAASAGRLAVMSFISNDTTLYLSRGLSGNANSVSWEVIEWNDGTLVRSGTSNLAPNTSNIVIPTIDTSKSVVAVGGLYNRGANSPSGNTNPSSEWNETILSESNLRFIKSGSSITNIGSYYVISFNSAAAAVTTFLDSSYTFFMN